MSWRAGSLGIALALLVTSVIVPVTPAGAQAGDQVTDPVVSAVPDGVGQGALAASRDLDEPIDWLAVGDSFSSGEGVKGQQGRCARAADAYPLVAWRQLAELGPNWRASKPTFKACTGGRSTGDHPADLPAQLATISDSRYDLITLTIGGNDLGFGDIIRDCFGGWLTRCSASETDLTGKIESLRDQLGNTYQLLRRDHLKPGGEIIVLGYPWLFEPSASWRTAIKTRCSGVHWEDVDMLRRVAKSFDEAISEVSAQHDARFLDVQNERFHRELDNPGFATHNLCNDPMKDRWIRRAGSGARIQSWFHPNRLGHAFEGEHLAKAIGRLGLTGGRPDVDTRRLAGRWHYQGSFPTDVASIQIEKDGWVEYSGEGDPNIWSGPLEERRKGEYRVLLSGGGTSGERRMTMELSLDEEGKKLTTRIDFGPRVFTRQGGQQDCSVPTTPVSASIPEQRSNGGPVVIQAVADPAAGTGPIGGGTNRADAIRTTAQKPEQSCGKAALIKQAKLPNKGRVRYVPPKSVTASSRELPKGPRNGYIDKHGNEWVKGPARSKKAQELGHAFEWDVQLTKVNKKKWKWLCEQENKKNISHLNVMRNGQISHVVCE